MQPAPASSSPRGAGSTVSGSTRATPSGHAIWMSASRGQYDRSPWNSVSSAYRGSSARVRTSSASRSRVSIQRGSTSQACRARMLARGFGPPGRLVGRSEELSSYGCELLERAQDGALFFGEVALDDVGAPRVSEIADGI